MFHIQSFAFNPFSENTYILYNAHKNAYLIDPGNFSEDENQKIAQFISDNNLSVKKILLTHAHIDHVLGLQWAYDRYKVPVLLHETEQEILDRNPMDANRFGFFFKPFEGDIQYLCEGDTLKLDEDVLEIKHVPGHSPGHIAFYCNAQDFIISGDVLFEGSIGRTDLYKGNQAELLNSIRTKLFTLPEATKVYNGHGNPTTVDFEKRYNPFFK